MIMVNGERFTPEAAPDPELKGALSCLGTAIGALREYVDRMPCDTKSAAARALAKIEAQAEHAGGKVAAVVCNGKKSTPVDHAGG